MNYFSANLCSYWHWHYWCPPSSSFIFPSATASGIHLFRHRRFILTRGWWVHPHQESFIGKLLTLRPTFTITHNTYRTHSHSKPGWYSAAFVGGGQRFSWGKWNTWPKKMKKEDKREMSWEKPYPLVSTPMPPTPPGYRLALTLKPLKTGHKLLPPNGSRGQRRIWKSLELQQVNKKSRHQGKKDPTLWCHHKTDWDNLDPIVS